MLKSLNLKYSIEKKKKCMYIFVSFFHCSKHIWIKQVIIYQEMQQKESGEACDSHISQVKQ